MARCFLRAGRLVLGSPAGAAGGIVVEWAPLAGLEEARGVVSLGLASRASTRQATSRRAAPKGRQCLASSLSQFEPLALAAPTLWVLLLASSLLDQASLASADWPPARRRFVSALIAGLVRLFLRRLASCFLFRSRARLTHLRSVGRRIGGEIGYR